MPATRQTTSGAGAVQVRPGFGLRILVTGSRDWADPDAVAAATAEAAAGWPPQTVTVVHGGCPTGADAHADAAARAAGHQPEDHPADWSTGRSAGPRRNAAMVATGIDVCLAFIGPCRRAHCTRRAEGPHPSHGASGCADLAQRAGVPVRHFGPWAAAATARPARQPR